VDERTAIITGAGTGIGKASALALAQDGFNIVLAGRRKEPLETTAHEVEGHGVRALAVPTDVASPDSIAALFETADRAFSRLDLLFNNAGIGAAGIPFENLSVEQWRAVVDTNLIGAVLASQHAVRRMKAQAPQGGRIINNGSISAHAPRPNSAPYTATKHAITGLTKSIALDGRPFGIACGQIDVGNAATEISDRIAAGIVQADGRIAAEPRIDPALVGKAVAYMASLPLEANVLFMTVMATGMPFVGRG
jgi:NAD(P)-dependent dehydrogenase (short-subunit alcohol dehydrogenase family)